MKKTKSGYLGQLLIWFQKQQLLTKTCLVLTAVGTFAGGASQLAPFVQTLRGVKPSSDPGVAPKDTPPANPKSAIRATGSSPLVQMQSYGANSPNTLNVRGDLSFEKNSQNESVQHFDK
ncbi:hypothetical protein [Caballeronia sordidicola]|uniref:hypothetical protein n=1 Tax=Caballeronia sordidicola TaxID=196367 RepID=UPI001180CBA2|nr:hypothetical protein [Caballeronia sordidicola]